jgi:hypothetical protein
MRKKAAAIVASLFVTMSISLVMDKAFCALNSCVDDDASMRAMALLGIPLLVIYILATWGVLYPIMLAARRKLGLFTAPLVVTVPVSLVLAVVFHRPDIDGDLMHTVALLAPWFGVPWYCGGLAAIWLWPTNAAAMPRA